MEQITQQFVYALYSSMIPLYWFKVFPGCERLMIHLSLLCF